MAGSHEYNSIHPAGFDGLDGKHTDEVEFLEFKYVVSTSMFWLRVDATTVILATLCAICLLTPSISPFDQSNSVIAGVFFSMVSLIYVFQIVSDLEFMVKARILSRILNEDISHRALMRTHADVI